MKKIKGFIKTLISDELSIKASSSGDGRIIEGYFTTKTPDRGGEITLPTAFTKTMEDFRNNPIVLNMHKWDAPIGTMLDYKIDDIGVWVRIKLAEGVGYVDDLWKLIEQGVVKTFSFGYRVLKSDKVKVGDKFFKELQLVELLEISTVTIPMNATATFSMASGSIKSIDIKEDKVETPEGESVFCTEMKFDTDLYSLRDCFKLLRGAGIIGLIKNHEEIDEHHVFEFTQGIKMTDELHEALKDGILLTLKSDEKGLLADEIVEQERRRMANLHDLWWTTAKALCKLNLDDKASSKEAKNILKDFSVIASEHVMDFIAYEQEWMKRSGIEMNSLLKSVDRNIYEQKDTAEKELMTSRIKELETELTEEKAGRVISEKNKKLILEAIASMESTSTAMGSASENLKLLCNVEEEKSDKGEGSTIENDKEKSEEKTAEELEIERQEKEHFDNTVKDIKKEIADLTVLLKN